MGNMQMVLSVAALGLVCGAAGLVLAWNRGLGAALHVPALVGTSLIVTSVSSRVGHGSFGVSGGQLGKIVVMVLVSFFCSTLGAQVAGLLNPRRSLSEAKARSASARRQITELELRISSIGSLVAARSDAPGTVSSPSDWVGSEPAGLWRLQLTNARTQLRQIDRDVEAGSQAA